MFVKNVVILMVLYSSFIISVNNLDFFNFRNEKDILENLIQNAGYSVKVYNIWTEDGYRIRLHRIIYKNISSQKININLLGLLRTRYFFKPNFSRKKPSSIEKQSISQPILFVHGLLCSGTMWIANSTNSLAYLLSNAGYDVWIFNARGTSPSMHHRKWSSKSSEFWDFSWHEIGYYDLPRAFDFILEKTDKKRLIYVGHSQGTTAFSVALSTRPKYNDKIATAYLLAPAIYLEHVKGFVGLITRTNFSDNLRMFFNKTNTHFLHLRQTLLVDSILAVCQDPNVNMICSQLIYFIIGPGSEPTVDVFNMVISLIKYVGDNASVKQLLHYLQIIKSGTFQMFDYGPMKNELVYNDYRPPVYNLSSIKVPLICVSLTKDDLVTPEDAQKLVSMFSNVIQRHIIIPGNHLDFMFDPKAINLIKDEMLSYSKI